jgi:hypothetical protein
MGAKSEIIISGHVYRKNPEVDRFQIRLEDLGELRMMDIPPSSHLEIMNLPAPRGASGMECYGVNMGNSEALDVYGGASFIVRPEEEHRIISRLRRCFPEQELVQNTYGSRNPQIISEPVGEMFRVHLFLNFNLKDSSETLVRDAVAPFVVGYRRLEKPSVHVFICHASEDKPAARQLANAMAKLGADVWFDEWEIRVGDSIVQKINDALGKVSHLVVLLSVCSVAKPWVQRELSAALMQQLSQKSIRVLPVRIDDCEIPPIIADIRYADARLGMEHAFVELEQSLLVTGGPNWPQGGRAPSP